MRKSKVRGISLTLWQFYNNRLLGGSEWLLWIFRWILVVVQFLNFIGLWLYSKRRKNEYILNLKLAINVIKFYKNMVNRLTYLRKSSHPNTSCRAGSSILKFSVIDWSQKKFAMAPGIITTMVVNDAFA